MATARRQHLPKPTRKQLNAQWRRDGLDVDQRAHRFRQPPTTGGIGAGGLESYRLANDLSQVDVAAEYTARHGGGITGQIVSRWEHWPHGKDSIQPRLVVLERLADIYHTTVVNLVATIDHQPPSGTLRPTTSPPLQHAPVTGAADDVLHPSDATDPGLPDSAMGEGPKPTSQKRELTAAFRTMARDNWEPDAGSSLDDHGRNVDRRSAMDAMMVALGASLLEFTGSLRRSNVGERMLSYIETDAARFAVHYPEVAPGQLLAPVRQTFEVASHYLGGTQPVEHRRRLACAAAELATVLGMTLFNLGSQQQARWAFRAAAEAAAEAEDNLLGAWVLASECIIPTYNGDPMGVLALTERGHRLAAGSRCVVIAKLAALEAKAHASLGNVAAAREALARARRAMNSAAAEEFRAGPFGFSPAKHAFYEGTCYVRLSQPDAALVAYQRALDLYLSTRAFMDPTIARIDLAMAYSQKGELESACHLGEQVAEIPTSLRTDPIKARAAEFLGSLQPRHRALPAVQALRDRLALEPPANHKDERP